jgi:hypothetical protein
LRFRCFMSYIDTEIKRNPVEFMFWRSSFLNLPCLSLAGQCEVAVVEG